jgi:hypothetical protein
MSSTNQSPEYKIAESKFLMASTKEEKVEALEAMIRTAPKHKSSEKMLANLKTRYVNLKKELEKENAKKKGRSVGIKKDGDAQVTILGFANSGKSSLLAELTNAKPKISDIPFTTAKSEIGTLDLDGIKIQLIELPAYIENKEILGLARSSDLILVLVTSLEELIQISAIIKKENLTDKSLFILNKVELVNQEELKKFFKLNILRISIKEKAGINDLKQKIFENIGLIRVYTKEPGKKPKLDRPMIMKKDCIVKDMAEKIRKDFIDRFIKARIWGKSAKFDGQTVGIEHVLKDKDIVEMYIK